MPNITIYTKDYCPHCVKAKNLLKNKGVEDSITEIDISSNPAKIQEMLDRSAGMRTVPQIFIGDTHVGGADNLFALDKEGKLDNMLSS